MSKFANAFKRGVAGALTFVVLLGYMIVGIATIGPVLFALYLLLDAAFGLGWDKQVLAQVLLIGTSAGLVLAGVAVVIANRVKEKKLAEVKRVYGREGL